MANDRLTTDAVNRMDASEFVATFGDIAEHSPWVAEAAFAAHPFADHAALVAAFHAAIERADRSMQHTLLNEHPDLAGRVAIAGKLAPESLTEQAGAGLDRMTEAEYALFTSLNDRYRARHGIPFIRAVKGSTKEQIIEAFKARVENEPAAEFATALAQVARIIRFRLEDRVAS